MVGEFLFFVNDCNTLSRLLRVGGLMHCEY